LQWVLKQLKPTFQKFNKNIVDIKGISGMENSFSLRIAHLDKSFPGVHALDDVSINAKAGEILGLIGVNGAGKSTLMNILGGILQPDKGEIIIDGKSVSIKNPRAAEELGIAFIQQEIQLFYNLSVFENIFIADLNKWRKSKSLPFLDILKLKKEAKKYLQMLGCDINVNVKASSLAVGEQQMVQIARALSQGGRILLFDEPTSSLSLKEKQSLFDIINKLKESHIIIIYISHHLDEIFELCDRAVVLRDGKVTGQGITSELTKEKIINFMLGHDIEQFTEYEKRTSNEKILEVRNLSGEKYPSDISFSLNKGEVLGIWGLLGSGRTELIRTLLDFDKKKSGQVFFGEDGELKPITGKSFFHKVGYITEGRHYDGLFLNMPIWENITSVYLSKFATKFLNFLKVKDEKQTAVQSINQVNVKAVNEDMIVSKMSGGNQQKVVISKWFIKEPKIIFMDEPTKGVDVGAKAEIQRLIHKMASEGVSFVVVSSEIEEIMSLSDRIIVLHQGKLVAEVNKRDFSKDNLMKGIIGGESQ
jgi:ABC-type sugar transport system ATPase subunit